MSTVTFGTLKFVERLKAGGMDKKTAKPLDSQLATKQGWVELKLDMIKWMIGLGVGCAPTK